MFTIGGSWNGGIFIKNGEIWSEAEGWQLLPGCPVGICPEPCPLSCPSTRNPRDWQQMTTCCQWFCAPFACITTESDCPQVAPMLTNDNQGLFRADNHGWFFGWTNGTLFQARRQCGVGTPAICTAGCTNAELRAIFWVVRGQGQGLYPGQSDTAVDCVQRCSSTSANPLLNHVQCLPQAGPSVAMNWYDTNGNGSYYPAGTRTGDTDAMNGNAVMFDAVQGLILTVGGAPSYQARPDCLGT